MSTVKLLSNLQTENGVIDEGQVVDLPDAQAAHLVEIGAAEVSDDKATAEALKGPEVEPAADPLATTTEQAGPQGQSEQPAPVSQPEQPTPSTPPSSSTNLHLG